MMNTTISFHNVTNIEVKETYFPKDAESAEFYTKRLIITDVDGNESEITLFAGNRSALMLDN